MTFAQYLKTLTITQTNEITIPINQIQMQYNPDRFKSYKQTTTNNQEPLKIENSPHVALLKEYDKIGHLPHKIKHTQYYQMQTSYGKTHDWIIEKIHKFIKLHNYIQQGHEPEKIIILTTPIIKNKYNNNYEVYEGHHRISSYYTNNITIIKVILAQVNTNK